MKNYLRLSPFIHSRTGTALTCTQVILQILRVLDGESINDDSLEEDVKPRIQPYSENEARKTSSETILSEKQRREATA